MTASMTAVTTPAANPISAASSSSLRRLPVSFVVMLYLLCIGCDRSAAIDAKPWQASA